MAVSQTVQFEDSNSADSAEFGMKSILLKGLAAGEELELIQAVSSPPRITRGMDEAATLEIEVSNQDRSFSSKKLPKFYAEIRGLRFAYTGWDKTGNYVNLTLEDAVVNKLRNYKQPLKWDAGKVQLKQILKDIADTTQVLIKFDPDLTAIVQNVTEMKDGDNAWDLLKSLASERNLRCFSDGWQVFFGWDGWLATITPPVPLSEPRPNEPQSGNPVYNIDMTLDEGMTANTAKVTVDSELWALPPGRCVEVSGEGWGDGIWLVSHFERTLTSATATVDLVRRRAPLPEPESTTKNAEQGEDGFDTSDASVVNIDEDLSRLRQCESTGNYKANTGNGYYGAYQFDIKTWQGLGYSGRPDQATPAKQDEAAQKLYQQRGWSPWPSCSKKLGLVDKRNSGGGSGKATGGNTNLVSIAVAMAKSNPRYDYGGKKPNGPWDCSGFVAEATKRAGKQLAGGSKQQKATCQKQGKLVTVAVGLKTPGAILFRMKVINGNTHVAISMGDGRTVEARGSADGVGVFGNASGRGFDFAAIWI